MIKKLAFLMVPGEKGIGEHGYTYLPPLSLGVLAGYMKERGYEAELFDLNRNLAQLYSGIEEDLAFFYQQEQVLGYIRGQELPQIEEFLEKLLADVSLESYDMVGISCGADFSFMQIHSAFMLAQYIQKKYNIPIVLGGNNITYLYLFKDTFHELLETVLSKFPYVFKGAGEVALEELLSVLNSETPGKTVDSIGGLVYLKDGEVCANSELEPQIVRPDWCNLPMEYYYAKIKDPEYGGSYNVTREKENLIHLFKWPFFLTHYVSTVRKKRPEPGLKDTLVLPYVFNYHCPYACAFCTQSDVDKHRVILGDVQKTVDDLEQLMEKHQTNYFYFFNNAANASAKFIDEFCEEVIKRKLDLRWTDCARFNNLTYERLKQMKEAGCCKLVFGFETASEKLIKLVDKKIDLAHGEQVIRWCHELGIWVDLEVIVGLPQERDEDFQDTVDFVNRNKPYLNYMTINEFFVVPNSLIGRHPERYGIELIRNVMSYDKILQRSWNYLKESKGKQTGNFKVYKYNEINGRDYKEVTEKTRKYIKVMNDLQHKEFAEVEYVYRILEKKI